MDSSSPSSSPSSSTSSASPSPDWKPSRPNILITGTPGVGKTTLASRIALELGLRHIEVGAFARERDLLADFDDKFDTYYMHEDAVLDALEPLMGDGGIVLDHHSVDWFPERWIQMAVVLRTKTDILYDRLTNERKYTGVKLDNNMEAEIMQVILDETVQAYAKLNVLQLDSNCDGDTENNMKLIKKQWNKLILSSSDTATTQDGEQQKEEVVH